MNITITIPITIITPKISNTKTNFIFYAGKNLAEVQTGTHEYVLTSVKEHGDLNELK